MKIKMVIATSGQLKKATVGINNNNKWFGKSETKEVKQILRIKKQFNWSRTFRFPLASCTTFSKHIHTYRNKSTVAGKKNTNTLRQFFHKTANHNIVSISSRFGIKSFYRLHCEYCHLFHKRVSVVCIKDINEGSHEEYNRKAKLPELLLIEKNIFKMSKFHSHMKHLFF